MLAEKPVRQETLTHAWHLSVEAEVLEQLGSSPTAGLNDVQVKARLEQYGANELVEGGLKSPLVILWEQIRNPLVLLLIFAAILSAFLGKADNVTAISAIVILNAVLTTVVLQMLAVYTPFFNNLFNTNPLTPGQLAICFVLSTIVFWGVELEKLLIRRGVLK